MKRNVTANYYYLDDEGNEVMTHRYKDVVSRAQPDAPIHAYYYNDAEGKEWEATYDNLDELVSQCETD